MSPNALSAVPANVLAAPSLSRRVSIRRPTIFIRRDQRDRAGRPYPRPRPLRGCRNPPSLSTSFRLPAKGLIPGPRTPAAAPVEAQTPPTLPQRRNGRREAAPLPSVHGNRLASADRKAGCHARRLRTALALP